MVVINFLQKFEVHSTLILALLLYLQQIAEPRETMSANVGVSFEVFGRVQGVFFRKHTQSKAKELGLNGWCKNTKEGTVLGYVEGDKNKIEEMKNWLQSIGSPQSVIDKAEFRNEKELGAPTLNSFTIKK